MLVFEEKKKPECLEENVSCRPENKQTEPTTQPTYITPSIEPRPLWWWASSLHLKLKFSLQYKRSTGRNLGVTCHGTTLLRNFRIGGTTYWFLYFLKCAGYFVYACAFLNFILFFYKSRNKQQFGEANECK